MISSLNLLIFPKSLFCTGDGYHPERLTIEFKKISPQILTKIKFELSEKPSKPQKEAEEKSGFVPVRARWVIERSNSWMERCKILVKNFERTLANATAKMNLCFIRLMVKRLAV
ncbi:MAG: transposase [Microcoleus sp.]